MKRVSIVLVASLIAACSSSPSPDGDPRDAGVVLDGSAGEPDAGDAGTPHDAGDGDDAGPAITCSCPLGGPGAGKTCVTGQLFDFSTGARVAAGGGAVVVSAYEPLTFLGSPSAPPLATIITDSGCFTLTFPTPALGLVALSVTDPPAGPSPARGALAIGTTIAHVTVGNFAVDASVVPKNLVTGWKTASGLDYAGLGAYVACFYDDPPPPAASERFTETSPVSGVQLTEDGQVPSRARYLRADRTLDTNLNATGALGCAVVSGAASVATYGGMGVAQHWEALAGGTRADLVVVQRLHSCDQAPLGTSSCP